MNHNFISQEILVITGVFASFLFGLLGWWIRKEIEKRKQFDEKLDKLIKTCYRIQKAMIIQARMLDDNTKKNHPDEHVELEKLVKEMLKDSNGGI